MSAILLLTLSCPAVGQTISKPADAKNIENAIKHAKDFFTAGLGDQKNIAIVLAGLRSTKSPSLLPLYKIFITSDDKALRMIATLQIAEIAGDKSVKMLRERLLKDPQMAIRVRALLELEKLKKLSEKDLDEAIKMNDQEIRLIAARALVRKRQFAKAKPVLRKLIKSKNQYTSVFARITLVRLGDRPQIAPLKKIALSNETDADLKLFMLTHIMEEKIEPLLPIVEELTEDTVSNKIRIRAFQALSVLSPQSLQKIARKITDSDSVYLQINLLRIIANSKNPDQIMRGLSKIKGVVGKVARFEYLRSLADQTTSIAVQELLESQHPIVIEYVMNRMKDDIKKLGKKANFYTKPVLKYINSVKLTNKGMTRVHDQVAKAISLLGDLGSADALAGIKKILAREDKDTLVTLAVGALYRSTNKAVAPLVKPLLKNPLWNIKYYAALTLAKFGNKTAIPVLIEIQNSKNTQTVDLMTLANWYILELTGNAKTAFEKIAKDLNS